MSNPSQREAADCGKDHGLWRRQCHFIVMHERPTAVHPAADSLDDLAPAQNREARIDDKALNPDGSLASETISVTSANGLCRARCRRMSTATADNSHVETVSTNNANSIVSPQWVWWPFILNPSIFDQTYGSLSNADFVTQLFQNSVGRNPTASESADWVAMLDAGTVSRGDMIYALAESQDHLAYIGSQAGQAVTASNQTLNYAENAIVRITGGGNTINAASGDVLTVGGNGANGATNTINMSNGSASLRANSRMDVVGSRNVVTAAAGSTLGVNGDDNLVSAGGDSISINGGAGNVVNGSGNTVSLAANLSANLVGDGNTINAQSGAKITISTNGQSGAGDIVNMSNGLLTMAGGSKATINGSGNNVTLEFGENLTLAGNNNKVVFGAGNDVVTDSGSSETFVFRANFGQDTLAGFDSTDHMQVESAIFSDWAHLIGAAQQVGADTIITASPTDTITLKNVAVSSLNQGQFQFV